MFYDIRSAEARPNHQLRLVFADGVTGVVDLDSIVRWEGVFEPLRVDVEFRKVRVNTETGTAEWPNGADLDSIVLYSTITEKSIEEILGRTVVR